jgi:TatD family-associated radical SAM protein
MDDFVYKVKDGLYINLTNRCTNQCSFCIRNLSRKFEGQYPLWLDKEPMTQEILNAIGDPSQYSEIVFCGYGEPLIRFKTVVEVAKALKERQKDVKLRIDTNGTANIFYGRNILGELKGLIDKISVSLNAHDEEVYEKLCQPMFGKKAFAEVIKFAEEAKKVIPEVEITIVKLRPIKIRKCKEIAKKIGVKFRVRPFYKRRYKE